MLFMAESGLRHGTRVGAVIDGAGRVVDLNHTYDSSVRFVRDDEDDPGRLMIAFWAYSPVCYLPRDHHEFGRIRDLLASAAGTDRYVIFACRDGEDANGEPLWPNLMDVRPLDPAEPTPAELNGHKGAEHAPDAGR
jgi:hypothetical protein